MTLAPEVIDWIIEQTCKDRSYGARPLRRAIQRYIEDPLSEELIRGHLKGGEIEVYLDGGTLCVSPRGRGPGRPATGLSRLRSCAASARQARFAANRWLRCSRGCCKAGRVVFHV